MLEKLINKLKDKNFKKHILLQTYFLFFIFLNIIDFLNIIGGDLDFFKKILSWILIAFIFYKVSFTKILIGKKHKYYDIFFILIFSLLVIPKSIFLYSLNINISNLNSINNFNFSNIENYYIFGNFLKFFATKVGDYANNFILIFFFSSIILQIITIISLLNNSKIKKKSLIGSFNFKNNYFGIFKKYILSFFICIFFSIIVFNLFMEWFALAVDSIILVLGLIYYLFYFIQNLTKNQFSNLLSNISNSGNNFFINLIEKFSNKKTFFIGTSFLLVLHLLVDCGVYLIPFSIGTYNSLYFTTLDVNFGEHLSLFNFYQISNSQFYKDFILIKNTNFDIFILFGILLIYILNLFLFFSCLILPFYIFYKLILNKKIYFSKYFQSFFFVSIILYFTCFLILPNIDNPLNIRKPKDLSIKGIDIYTKHVLKSLDYLSILLIILEFFICLFTFLILTKKYEIFFLKIFYLIILIFFLFYIILFFINIVENQIYNFKNNIKNNLDKNLNKNSNYNIEQDFKNLENEFKMKKQIYSNHTLFSQKEKKVILKSENLKIEFTFFSDFNLKKYNINQNHNDYLYLNITNYSLINKNYQVKFLNKTNTFYNLEIYNKSTKNFKEKNFTIIYFLGQNFYTFEKNNLNYKKINLNLNKINFQKIITFQKQKNNQNKIYNFNKINSLAQRIRFFFSCVFYIFGTIQFTKFYIKKIFFN